MSGLQFWDFKVVVDCTTFCGREAGALRMFVFFEIRTVRALLERIHTNVVMTMNYQFIGKSKYFAILDCYSGYVSTRFVDKKKTLEICFRR